MIADYSRQTLRRIIFYLGLFLILTLPVGAEIQTRDKLSILNITILNFENNQGQVLVTLFNSEEGFPIEASKAFRFFKGDIKDKKAQVIFDFLPAGVYAVGVVHDEDNSGKMNSGFLGIPSESVGVSNDAKGSFGPPSFENAKFIIKKKELKKISIHLD
tara:strand:+ start:2175 stop:2651 length:477 start_codon:yes stop_codon:yes gene_type:complete